jgi:hypothetical protein
MEGRRRPGRWPVAALDGQGPAAGSLAPTTSMAMLAERYGYVNRSLADAELDGFVDGLAMRIASSTVPASPEAGYNTLV